MGQPLFQLETISLSTPSIVPQCGRCGLYKTCISPKMKVSGQGKKKVLISGEAPGREEDNRGTQFVGKTGQLLRRVARSIGVDLNRDCWLTNSLLCRPIDNVIKNEKMISWCRPNLLNTIKELKPDVIILLGGVAVTSLIGHLWKEDIGGVNRWAGWRIPCQKINTWICPTWHPSYVARTESPVLDMYFKRHLEAAFELEGKPWTDWQPNHPHGSVGPRVIRCEYNSEAVVKWVRSIIANPKGILAFDYETTHLKPDSKDAEIVCCSICHNGVTWAFPWQGRIPAIMRELLQCPIPKVGWSIKFEDRWTRAKLGVKVNNWIWDGMNVSHILDNRPGITGLKFQAFVRLGTESYNDQIKPFLESKVQGGTNRIKEVPLQDLLYYCGMDSLLEYQIDKMQMEETGFSV